MYGAAARLITLILLPTMIISAVVPPMIAELYAQRDLKKLENILRGTATLSAIPSFFILMLFIFSGEAILKLIYGSEFYYNAGQVLAILSCAQLVSIWAGPCAQLLLMSNNTKALLAINLSALIIAISLALIFTPMYGMTGIASSYAIATILLNIAMAGYCSKKIGVKTHAKFSTSVFRLILERKSRVRAPNLS